MSDPSSFHPSIRGGGGWEEYYGDILSFAGGKLDLGTRVLMLAEVKGREESKKKDHFRIAVLFCSLLFFLLRPLGVT